MFDHVFSPGPSLVTEIGDLKFRQKHKVITLFFLCVFGGPVFPLPQETAGKVPLPESTHPNPAERIALLGCGLPQTSGDTEEAVSALVSLFWRR